MPNSRNTITWGAAPTSTCMKLWEYAEPEDFKDVLLWGIGDGRNAIFLAGQGYNVTAVDVSEDSFTDVKSWMGESNVNIECMVSPLTSKDLGGPYDMVISVGMVNIIPKDELKDMLAYVQSITRDGGFNAISGFIGKPFIGSDNDSSIESGDILKMYHQWRVHWITQSLIKTEDSVSCVDRVIAEKIASGKVITLDMVD